MIFSEAQVNGPIDDATGRQVDEIPINLATDGKSVVLTYGNEFNITYEDQSTITLCKVEKQSSHVLLRNGLSNDDRKNLLT